MSREEDFNRQLDAALRREHLAPDQNSPKAAGGSDMSGLAFGMRLALEMLGGTLVGLGIGLFLDSDKGFGTAPLFTLIFTLFGFCAGILNVYRFINRIDDTIGVNRRASLTKTAETPIRNTGENPQN